MLELPLVEEDMRRMDEVRRAGVDEDGCAELEERRTDDSVDDGRIEEEDWTEDDETRRETLGEVLAAELEDLPEVEG